jgi:hypothetical protein
MEASNWRKRHWKMKKDRKATSVEISIGAQYVKEGNDKIRENRKKRRIKTEDRRNKVE